MNSRTLTFLVGVVCPLVAAWLLGGCSSATKQTVSGVVISIDSLSVVPAGLKVYLLDHEDTITTTNENGEFSLEIPDDKDLLLVVDDGDDATSDDWYPLINHRYDTTITGSISDLIIHACPQPETADLGGLNKGTIAIIQNSLEKTDHFNTESVNDTSGLILTFNWQSPNNSVSGFFATPGIKMTVAEADTFGDFQYQDLGKTGDGNDPTAAPDGDIFCDSSNDVLCPAGANVTGLIGVGILVGDPAYGGKTISYATTIPDTDLAGESFTYPELIEVPVRPNMFTLVSMGCIDGVCPVETEELLKALGFIS